LDALAAGDAQPTSAPLSLSSCWHQGICPDATFVCATESLPHTNGIASPQRLTYGGADNLLGPSFPVSDLVNAIRNHPTRKGVIEQILLDHNCCSDAQEFFTSKPPLDTQTLYNNSTID
jgi:hypothetical protein